MDKPVPKSKMISYRSWSRAKLKSIKCPPACGLAKVVLEPVQSFAHGGKPITFQRLYYLKGLLNKVEGLCPSCKHISINCKLRNNLVQYNFNYPRFISYQIESINGLVNSHERLTVKLNALSYQLGGIKQLIPMAGMYYRHGEIQVHKFLINWIKEEITYLKKNHVREPAPQIKRGTGQGKEFKIRVPCSKAEFASIIRALINIVVLNVKKGKTSGAIKRNTQIPSEQLTGLVKEFEPLSGYLFLTYTWVVLAVLGV